VGPSGLWEVHWFQFPWSKAHSTKGSAFHKTPDEEFPFDFGELLNLKDKANHTHPGEFHCQNHWNWLGSTPRPTACLDHICI
jgi:hypothetical protein